MKTSKESFRYEIDGGVEMRNLKKNGNTQVFFIRCRMFCEVLVLAVTLSLVAFEVDAQESILVTPEIRKLPSLDLAEPGSSSPTIENPTQDRTLEWVADEEPIPTITESDDESSHSEYEVIDFPKAHEPLPWKIFEAIPSIITKPHIPMAEAFAELFCTEHYKPATDLSDVATGPQPIPPRPDLIFEMNERFLAPGFLNQGIELRTGAVWRPSIWVFGEFRSAIQYYDNALNPSAAEWANRLDLFTQLNLTGTERILLGLRPLDKENFNQRNFTGFDMNNGRWDDNLNADIQTLFFEGDFGEIFPWLDRYDMRQLDYGFSVGRMPLLAQQGLLINEDIIDAVTLTRNTLSGNGNLNLRITGLYAWNELHRNSPGPLVGTMASPNSTDPNSQMVAILTESDFEHNTVNLDAAYIYSDGGFGNLIAFGASAIRRIHGFHNTYNTSLHVLASFPTNGTTEFAQQGELLFAQTSWTPHHTDDLIYVNGFLAIDQFTSPTRGPQMGSPLGQTGILFAATGLGRAGAPIGTRTNNIAGGSLGYQFFFENTRRQLILEVGGHKETEGPRNLGAVGTTLRYQQAIGQHHIVIIDGFVGKREALNPSQGARFEVRVKF